MRSGERFDLVPVDTIDWIEAADNYVQLHCGAARHLLGETLTSLERRLDPRRFLRIHRSRIVNASRVVAVHVLVGGTYELELRGGPAPDLRPPVPRRRPAADPLLTFAL